MKKYITTFGFVLMSITANAQSGSNEKVAIRTDIHCDHCRECPSCGKKLQSGLLRIPGVKMYELDDKTMTIHVYYNPKKTDVNSIRKAISGLGYDADDIKADPVAYEKLDDCCKRSEY